MAKKSELKARVEACRAAPEIKNLDPAWTEAFNKAVESAKTFDDLPEQFKLIIERAEAST